jgi:hypothetical protein
MSHHLERGGGHFVVYMDNIQVKYQAPPRTGNGYSLVIPSELIIDLSLGEVSLEVFISQCLDAIKEFREANLKG